MEPDSDVALLIEGDPERRFGLFAFLDLAFADAMRPKLRAAVLRDAVEVF